MISTKTSVVLQSNGLIRISLEPNGSEILINHDAAKLLDNLFIHNFYHSHYNLSDNVHQFIKTLIEEYVLVEKTTSSNPEDFENIASNIYISSNNLDNAVKTIIVKLTEQIKSIFHKKGINILSIPIKYKIIPHQKMKKQMNFPSWVHGYAKNDMIILSTEYSTSFLERDIEHSIPGLMHEIAHIYIHNMFKLMPYWLNEGLAEYITNRNFTNLNKKTFIKFNDLLSQNYYSLLDLDSSILQHNIAYYEVRWICDKLITTLGLKTFLKLMEDICFQKPFNSLIASFNIDIEKYEKDCLFSIMH